MRMMSIASGSSGNCIYIGTDNTHVLIDAGISKKRIVQGLAKLDLTLDDIDAIFITHEHDDHIKGVGVLERQCVTPLYGTACTLSYISKSNKLGTLPDGIYHSIIPGEEFCIKDLFISSTSISHDAIDPVAYTFSDGKKKAGVITDLGVYNDEIINKFYNLNSLLIESNHDINMLMTGPYPYILKQRILGETGHLSNESCGRLLEEIIGPQTENILLGHLSKENNFPELAFETVRMEINMGSKGLKAEDFNINVAKREDTSDIISI